MHLPRQGQIFQPGLALAPAPLQAILWDGAQLPQLLNCFCLSGFLGGSGKQGWLVLMYINVGVQSSAYGDLGLGVDAKFPLVIPRVQAEASEREERIKRQQFRRATSLLCTEDNQTLSETVTRVKSPSMLADPQLVTTTANLTLSTSEEPGSGSDSTTNQLCGPAGYICFSHSPLFPHVSLEREYFFFFKGLSTRERGGFAFPWF